MNGARQREFIGGLLKFGFAGRNTRLLIRRSGPLFHGQNALFRPPAQSISLDQQLRAGELLKLDVPFQQDLFPIVDHLGEIGLNPKRWLSIAKQETNGPASANQAFVQFVTGFRAGQAPLQLTIAGFLFKLQ